MCFLKARDSASFANNGEIDMNTFSVQTHTKAIIPSRKFLAIFEFALEDVMARNTYWQAEAENSVLARGLLASKRL
jgi:hypothetical protein